MNDGLTHMNTSTRFDGLIPATMVGHIVIKKFGE